MSLDSDDIQVSLKEPEAVAVAVVPPPAVGVNVVAPDSVAVAVATPSAEAIEVAIAEPQVVAASVDAPPVIGISTEPPEVMVISAANVGQRGLEGPEGPPGVVGPFREGHTFAVLGVLQGVTVLPTFFVPKHANQTVKLHGLHSKLVSGSIQIQITRNGTNVAAPVVITSAKTFTSLGDVALADGDEISAVLLNPVGSPETLSATVVLEWSVP